MFDKSQPFWLLLVENLLKSESCVKVPDNEEVVHDSAEEMGEPVHPSTSEARLVLGHEAFDSRVVPLDARIGILVCIVEVARALCPHSCQENHNALPQTRLHIQLKFWVRLWSEIQTIGK